jgi:D,D-heptose 1,7-bisphosphate phosphatase
MTQATITQCAVLVGSPGTHLGSLRANMPKPLLRCGDRPFLAWLLREFVRYGVTEFLLLSGYQSTEVEKAVQDIIATLPGEARIAICEGPVGAGTGGAIYHARERLDERFLLCNGYSLLDCNIANLLAAAANDDESVTGRMVLHQVGDASRFGLVMVDGDQITGFREPPRRGTDGIINGGIYVFCRRLLDVLSPRCSLDADIMPHLAADGALRGTLGGGYFCDISFPEDFARAQAEIPHLLRRRAVFFDRDGVLNIDHGYVGTRERFEWMPGALEAIRYATEAGWHVFVVTNQSGVARGIYDEAAVRDLLAWMANQARFAGGTIDEARYCPFHDEAVVEAYHRASDWRKPEPGMLLDLIRAWELDPVRCVMIGDQPTDMAAAAAAGVPGHLFTGGNLLEFVREIVRP